MRAYARIDHVCLAHTSGDARARPYRMQLRASFVSAVADTIRNRNSAREQMRSVADARLCIYLHARRVAARLYAQRVYPAVNVCVQDLTIRLLQRASFEMSGSRCVRPYELMRATRAGAEPSVCEVTSAHTNGKLTNSGDTRCTCACGPRASS